MSKHGPADGHVESPRRVRGVDPTPEQRHVVYNAVVNNVIEGWSPTPDAVADLTDFVTGAITAEEHQARVLARAGITAPAAR